MNNKEALLKIQDEVLKEKEYTIRQLKLDLMVEKKLSAILSGKETEDSVLSELKVSEPDTGRTEP